MQLSWAIYFAYDANEEIIYEFASFIVCLMQDNQNLLGLSNVY